MSEEFSDNEPVNLPDTLSNIPEESNEDSLIDYINPNIDIGKFYQQTPFFSIIEYTINGKSIRQFNDYRQDKQD